MKNLVKNAILATATTALISTGTIAHAKIKEIKFHVVQGQFDEQPYMEMKYSGGAWNWTSKSKSFNTRMKIYFKATKKVYFARVQLSDSGAALWSLPAGYQTKRHEELITAYIGSEILYAFQNEARSLCNTYGGSQKAERIMNLNARFNVAETYPVGQSGDTAHKNYPFPVRIVCQPKPDSPARAANLKVTELKLYTVPAKPVCGRPVKLVTEIWTNKPGKVDFMLTRADGPKQAASVTTEAVSNGNVTRWSKTYTHNKSVDLSYQVVLTKQAMASNWAYMKLECGAGADIKRPGAVKN